MDYCYACRRHLNGALACAGCGTPAEDLGRPAADEPAVYELHIREPVPAGHRRARKRPGRARRARRRSGRRTALFATLGVVLAAGALSLAELATEAPQHGEAAGSVREEDRPTEPPAPGGAESESPGRPSAVPAAQRSTVAGRGEPSGGPGTAAVTAAASASARPGPRGTASPGAPQPSSAAPGPSSPGQSDSPGTPAPPPASQPPPPPPPEPAPTETCTRFLWWCT
ncbi:SCO2400 family protein [Streptomyces sp. NBC_00344]|uniref:SCO2400 family protein n=1 Tax=Streptomyces sp. NBC_00344 TaxID=2975720 RepID=UPI002E1EE33F